MTLPLDRERTRAACRLVRTELLAERKPQGCWVGSLSSSPLATAAAVSALVLAEQESTNSGLPAFTPGKVNTDPDELYQCDLSELIVHSLHWLAQQQNDDGGWGDTDLSRSNLATTLLVEAAFHLTGVPAKYANLLERTEQYIESQGGIAALKRSCHRDQVLVAPVMMNYAVADLMPWRKVPALPFELATLSPEWRRRFRLPMLTYALPALAAIGLARFHHAPPRNPITRWLRRKAQDRCLALIGELQPPSGGFLDATPLTSFVVMSLASMGLADHAIVRRGVEFLLTNVRADGSWPIETNLATWNTAQALEALDWEFEPDHEAPLTEPPAMAEQSLDWLLACQHTERHPWTGAEPGGWAWTNVPGALPNADDTAAALLALAGWQRRWPRHRAEQIRRAAEAGVGWLLNLQDDDGGWPSFCPSPQRSAWDESSADVTANVMRALHAWHESFAADNALDRRIGSALDTGRRFLLSTQQPDGSWTALWFGNQLHPQEANPVYATAKVLMMCRDLGWDRTQLARRAATWLAKVQLAGGAWGAVVGASSATNDRSVVLESAASVEETALAVEALSAYSSSDQSIATAVSQGVSWLVAAVDEGRHTDPAPLGFYFARIWYYERLYPLIFTTRALECASRAARGAAAPVGAVR